MQIGAWMYRAQPYAQIILTEHTQKKHGKNAKDIRITDLVKLLDMAETASGSNHQHATGT